jgi:hypothetical protein
MLITILTIGLILCATLNGVQLAWNAKVKSKCSCGAASGRWIRWYDEPLSLGARWYAKRNYPRRWGDADFAKFSKLGRTRTYGEK